jgi:hypothetical protein
LRLKERQIYTTVLAGRVSFLFSFGGKAWQQPAFPYQGRCLQWIREQYLGVD